MSYKKHFLTTYLLLSLNLFADGYEECTELDKLDNNSIIKKEIIVNCNNQIPKNSNNTSLDLEIKLMNQRISVVENKIDDKLNHFNKEISHQYNMIDWWLKITSIIVAITGAFLVFLGLKTRKEIADEVIKKTESEINLKINQITSENNVRISEIKTEILQKDYRSFDKIRLELLSHLDEIILSKYETYEEILNEFEEKLEKIQNNKNTPIRSGEKSKNDDPFE